MIESIGSSRKKYRASCDLVKTTFVSAYDSVAYDLVNTRLSDSQAEAEELRPRPHVTGYFENGGFFLLFNLPFTCKRRQSGTENATFQKRSPEWRFLKTPSSRSRVYQGCYRISIILVFSCMWTGENDLNTLRVEAYLFSERTNRKAGQRAL